MEALIPKLDEVTGPSSTETKKDEKPKEVAHFWVNVGVRKNGKLLTLPMGIPLDKLKAKPVPNNDSEFAKLRQGEKELFEQFKAAYEQLKPGESMILPFEVEVRRINEQEVKENQEPNPFSVGKLTFSAPTPKPVAPAPEKAA